MAASTWTQADIPSQKGKTILITGANVGLGYESARALANKGAFVIMACRNLEKGEKARQKILAESPHANLELLHCDLADLSSVRRFANAIVDQNSQLHVLINNAGLNRYLRHESADAFELTFASNYLGHFALNGYLIKLLAQTPQSRVVSISSSAHLSAEINFDDLMSKKGYRMMRAYGQSKLATLIFAKEMQRRIEIAKLRMLSVAVHPGLVATNMMKRFGEDFPLLRLPVNFFASFAERPEVGVRPQLYCATERDVKAGAYYVPNNEGRPQIGYTSPAANDPDVASRLWQISEQLTGAKFAIPAK